MIELDLPDGQFDAVVCVSPCSSQRTCRVSCARLWRMTRPGGRLAVTTWGPRFLEPANTLFWRAVAAECPDLTEPFRPWSESQEPDSLKALFDEAGLSAPQVKAVDDQQRLESAEDWWTIVLGSGLRGTVEQIGPEAAARVRQATLRNLAADGVTSVECSTLHALRRSPAVAAALTQEDRPDEDGDANMDSHDARVRTWRMLFVRRTARDACRSCREGPRGGRPARRSG